MEAPQPAMQIKYAGSAVALNFPVLRAPAVSLGLGGFAVLCGLMPAIGLAALLPLNDGNSSAFVSLALVGGLAAPFIFASLIFGMQALYFAFNSLHVKVDAGGARTVRRILGQVTRVSAISRSHIADIEPRIAARYQNVFSSVPRYALVARHAHGRDKDVIVAEDLAGQALMHKTRSAILDALGIDDISDPPDPSS